MLISHKIELSPNNKHATYFAQAAGVARFAYNWGLENWKSQYKKHKENKINPKPSQLSLRRYLNSIKKEQFPWMLDVTKNAPQMALIQLGKAFNNFFKGHAKYPKFHKKGIHDSFSLTNDQFAINNSKIRIPHIGWVNMRESLRFFGKIMSATISRVANKWFVSVTVETSDKLNLPKAKNQGVVGVDLGVSNLATLSTGESITGVKSHKSLLIKLRKLSKSLSRKQKGSNNRNKARIKIAKLHFRIKNLRLDCLHKLTTRLTSCFHTIGIEDLNVKGMLKNHKLARAISDMGFYEFRRQLEYKANWRGGIVVIADRFFPSSKLCSDCGHKVEKMPLSIRKWSCDNCKSNHDRDINAAINLKNCAVSSTVKACGDESSGFDSRIKVKLSSVKQESNTKLACNI